MYFRQTMFPTIPAMTSPRAYSGIAVNSKMAAIVKKSKRETLDYQNLLNFSSVMFYDTTRKEERKVYKKTFNVERISRRRKLQNVSV